MLAIDCGYHLLIDALRGPFIILLLLLRHIAGSPFVSLASSAPCRLILSSPRLRPLQPKAGIHSDLLRQLLRPPTPGGPLPSSDRALAPPSPPEAGAILALADAAEAVLQAEPTCLRLQAPLKIFGDIHGQYSDLLKLFAAYGCVCGTENAPSGLCKSQHQYSLNRPSSPLYQMAHARRRSGRRPVPAGLPVSGGLRGPWQPQPRGA